MSRLCFMMLFCLVLLGCTSSYCNFNSTLDTMNLVFVDQWNRGIAATGDNFSTVGHYIAEDFATTESRLGNTMRTIYEPVSFENTGSRMEYVADLFIGQCQRGIQDTEATGKIIAQALCLCPD